MTWWLATAIVGAGCGGDSGPVDSPGSLQLTLELSGGAQIDEVAYEITGNDMPPMGGTVDTSAPGATASVEVFGIPPGDGYLVKMAATSVDGGTSCEGSTAFDVDVGRVTSVMVMLRCKAPQRLGGVRVNGKLNVCAELTKAVVSPLQTSAGFEIDVSAESLDAEGDPISFRWTPGGSFAEPTSTQTTYTCRDSGAQTITIEVSDDDFKDCIDSWSVEVECVGEEPAFDAGTPVTVSGLSPFSECDADFDPDAVFTLHSEVEPWIAVNPTNLNHVAVGWQQDRYSRGGGSRGHLSAVSLDGGQTWDAQVVPGLTLCSAGDGIRTTDPWIAFASNGVPYFASLPWTGPTDAGSIVVHRAEDGGESWGDPVSVDEEQRPLFNDKESITADPIDPCTLYAAWTRFEDLSMGRAGSAFFSRSTDCGDTWTEAIRIHTSDPAPIGLQVLVLPDGSLRAFSVGFVGRGDWQRELPLIVQHSSDQGDTWSEPTLVANARRDRPFAPDGTRLRSGFKLFDVAVDRNTGYLYAVWEQLFEEIILPARIAFSASTDGGQTWSAPTRIDRTPTDEDLLLEQAVVPSVEVSDDGTVGVTYYNFQNDTPGDSRWDTDHWFIHCHPDLAGCVDADSWSNAMRLTPSSFDFLAAPELIDGLFLGDYVGLAASGDDFFAFFSVTTDDDPANAVFVPIRAR